ncbi:hypothetical protein HF1_13180 [Mycoplasma haemofelis str. Langford 1]|uniref:Uncharacterized protein n=2 Tax=Mycoplasma haemofelis TaxID=29501 RepID=F6FGJ4_MYCHI|nr:hypothetical protein [Mycoplasma haemofelis]AEG73632.1 hypothetical protein MHF_1396 [Mycoplasma haemofelis Ohio2]CBY93326.1 hypothetical protein HF1_13180 [Mycoplasma haemofelis str. Langford 1]
MNSLTTKGLIGLGGLSAVGGGIALSKPHLFPNKTTLRTVIENDGWTPLSASHRNEITEVLEAYKKRKPSVFSNFTGDENDASSKLLGVCKSLYEKTIEDSNKEDSLKKLRRWCVIPKTAKERLEYKGVSLFSTTVPSSPNTESAEWVEKSKTYTSEASNKFSDLSFSNEGDNDKAKKLRERCNTGLGTKSTDESFDNTLEQIKLWCSNSKN